MTELHVLLVVDGRHSDLALRHVVVVVNVVAQEAHRCNLRREEIMKYSSHFLCICVTQLTLMFVSKICSLLCYIKLLA